MTIKMDSSAMVNNIIGKGKVGSHEFMMYDYKISLCPRTESHVWEKCLYAHRGERARRRHPSKYQAVQCPEARAKKACPRGDDCNCTHHLFEYWLHPDRYMTCLCELGPACNRPICFFAHHQSELRPLPSGLTHPEEDAFPSRRREQQQRNSNLSSPGSSSDPLAFFTKGPGSSSGGGGASACVSVPGATVVPPSVAVVLNRPDLAGLSDAFGALELLSPLDSAAAAASTSAASAGMACGSATMVGSTHQPAMQQRLSAGSDPAGPSSQLQRALLEAAVAAGASQRQRASSAPSLASSSSYTLLTQQQQPQLADVQQQQQQQMLLGPVSRQGSVGGQSACSGNSSTRLPVLTGVRASSSGYEVSPARLQAGPDRLMLQAVRPSLDMQAVRTSLELPAGIADSSMSSGGYSPAAVQLQLQLQLQQQLQQQQLAAQLHAQSSGVSLSAMSSMSLPASNCSSPLALANPRPVALNPAALQMLNPPVVVGGNPAFHGQASATMDTRVGLAQQQQQLGSMPAVVFAPRAVQQIRGQEQQQQLEVGVAYIQAAGQPLLLQQQQQQQQQMIPVQVVDDQNEQLSFSMWGPDGTYLLAPQPPMQQQQQQLQYIQQQQQQAPNYWQQQSMQQQQSMPQQQQQQPVTLLSVNANQAGGVGPEFQGWQQQQQQLQLQQQQLNQLAVQMQPQQLPGPRNQGTWS